MESLTLDGYVALVFWTVLACIIGAFTLWWFGALVWGLGMRHVTFPQRVRKVPVVSSVEAVKPVGMQGWLCMDCINLDVTGNTLDPTRIGVCVKARDELSSVFPTWMENEGDDSMDPSSAKPCKCCGSKVVGPRILFDFS